MPAKKEDPRYRIEALGRKHDRSTFSCGKAPLDHYLREQAGQDARKHIAATFVLCAGEDNAVFGYYTLSAISIDIGAWPDKIAKKLPRYPVIPATLLGRLAIDKRLQGKNAGEYLLMDALYRSLQTTQQVASFAIIVDAKDENAVSFYRHYEFIPFADEPDRLYLPMSTIEILFA